MAHDEIPRADLGVQADVSCACSCPVRLQRLRETIAVSSFAAFMDVEFEVATRSQTVLTNFPKYVNIA